MVLENLARLYRETDFLTIYIAEAHASDEWSLGHVGGANAEAGGKWNVKNARTMEERLALAQRWVEALRQDTAIESLYVVDAMNDAARKQYGAWPERLCVIEDGTIKFFGGQGPWDYKPHRVAKWLAQRFPGGSSNL